MADGYDIGALIANADLPAIIGSFTELRKRGPEFAAKCIFHSPDNNPSLTVYRKGDKWMFKCFSCGQQGDALDFIQAAEGIDDKKEAAKRLNGGATWTPRIAPEPLPPKVERVTAKPPADAPDPKFTHRELGEPQATIPFKDADGQILGYECRWPTVDKDGNPDKEVRMLTWGRYDRDGAKWQWGWGHFNRPRYLCGLDDLAARPNAPVLVVEGPGKRDAARQLLPQYVPVSWTGGANSWHQHDWEPLRGRRPLIWPDNDPLKAGRNGEMVSAGIAAGKALARLLSDSRGLACQTKIIDPSGMPDAWDIKDALAEGYTPVSVVEWAKPRISMFHVEPEPEPRLPGLPAEAEATPTSSPDEPPAPEFPADATTERLAPDLISMSEDAIAFAFAGRIEPEWRYVREWDRWFRWDGDGWEYEKTDWIDRLAVEQCRAAAYWPEAATLSPDGRRRICQRRTAGAVRDTTKNDRRIAARSDQWDSDPLMIGVPGGVFDVRQGKIMGAAREQYVSKRTLFAPGSGKPRRWMEHLKRMTAGDDALVDFLQLYAGYSATGDISEQCFVFLHGLGQTGKGTFCLTLHDLLGTYACMSTASVFMDRHGGEKHASEIARFLGVRLVVIDEVAGGSQFNEERIKRMTGGGKITANFMRCDPFDITPTWKLLFAGNDKPGLRGVGKEMERRIRLVQCNAQIADEQVDRHFRDKMLSEEGPQIMSWILEGAVNWHSSGLTLPESIEQATKEYLADEDVIGEWIVERCEQRVGAEMSRPHAHKNYKDWCQQKDVRAWSSKSFAAALEKRGYGKRRTNSDRFITGLALKQVEPRSGGQGEPPAWHSDDDR